MPDLDVTVARWLVSPSGLDAIAASTRQRATDAFALLSFTRGLGLEPDRARAVVAATLARRRARERWPQADRLVFTREALEQASDPDVSAWRARRYAEHDAVDLCAGVGGDTIALGHATARSVTAVELDPARLVLLAHNAAASDVEVRAVAADARTVRVPAGGAVHADPSRRRAGRRVCHLDDHDPPVGALLARHGTAHGVGIVVAPGADTSRVGGDVEVEYVQRGPTLLEATIWRGALRASGALATATLLPGGQQRSRDRAEPVALPVGPIGDHLVTVAPAAVRARLHDEVGGEIGAHRIAVRRALLTGNGRPPPSPWYRARRVRTVLPARPRAVRAWLRRADPGPVELLLHGLERDVDRWWSELGRPPRGPNGVRIELTRLDDGAAAIVTDPGVGGHPIG